MQELGESPDTSRERKESERRVVWARNREMDFSFPRGGGGGKEERGGGGGGGSARLTYVDAKRRKEEEEGRLFRQKVREKVMCL